ncbi:MAG TPA: class I SAM-dependent methyltransferase [Pyrinomonadaceae bacterium]|nr:class I SAM-dependent methyltransferase [Pyrinomonadaceae bacterium]
MKNKLGLTEVCPQCSEKSLRFFETGDRNRRLSGETFNYYRCPACELIFLRPIPANLGDYYPPSYYSSITTYAELLRAAQPEQYKIEIVKQFAPGGRLLEIGPGGGGFVCLAKEAGYEVEAIEMDSGVCRFLTEVVGVQAINSADVGKALEATKSYDIIALWHNFEHLPEPWEALEAAATSLAPNGVLVIAAPNPFAFQFRVLGRFWTHVDAPRHLQLIPISVLVQRAESLGLTTRLITTRDVGTLGWNAFGWRESFGNFITFSERAKLLARRIGDAVSWLLRPVEQSGLRGSAYTIVFQRRC